MCARVHACVCVCVCVCVCACASACVCDSCGGGGGGDAIPKACRVRHSERSLNEEKLIHGDTLASWIPIRNPSPNNRNIDVHENAVGGGGVGGGGGAEPQSNAAACVSAETKSNRINQQREISGYHSSGGRL